MALNINPNAPTQEEIAEHERKVTAHNMKIAKANMASKLCESMCRNPGLASILLTDASVVSNASVEMAENIIEAYSLMPDAAGNKGGLVS